VIDTGEQADHRRVALPSHGLGKLDDGLDGVEQIGIPVLFSSAPAPFDGMVFAVGR
jgi:hypothetical protein